MAALALRAAVRAEQGKFSCLVVIEQAGLPVTGVVTVATFGAVASLVAVVFQMAVDTRPGRIGEVRRVGMTTAASGLDMAAEQAEPGARVIELRCRFPARAVVAGIAAFIQRAAVLVILAMAADAGLRCALVLALDLMTTDALGVAVFAQQCIAGFGVIETRRFPVAFDVTFGTVLAHRAAVRIVLLVTAQAIVGEAFDHRAFNVAILAFDFVVGAEQLELGARMVELLDGLPVVRHMTFAAFLTQASLVAVVLAVTLDAFTGCLAMLLAGGMAATALGADVLAGQCEIGLQVIETRFVEFDDRRIHAKVIRVAQLAASFRLAAVQAALASNVGGDILVAIQAQLRLLFLVEGGMAKLALGLVLLVSLDHGTGHQGPFELAGVQR